MIRFFIALWSAKLVDLFYVLRGMKNLTDTPGIVAYKLCPDFLARVSKPDLVISITGTNGKTTTSTLVCNMLRHIGRKVGFNPGGYNLKAGYCLNLMRGVTIFNRCRIDASVLETDELTMPSTIPLVKPNYVIVTNICKDSLRRNGHPDYIFSRIEDSINAMDDKTILILNANDPISFTLAESSAKQKIFLAMSDCNLEPLKNIAPDIEFCPYCGAPLKYKYRLYRHIGNFHCSHCDFSSPLPTYCAENIDLTKRTFTVSERNGTSYEYKLISSSVFNAFNVLTCIAISRQLGISQQTIADFLSTEIMTEERETSIFFDGKEYLTYAAKSQNVSAASTVFEYMGTEESKKVLVMCMDELQDKQHPPETLTWLYETDYEALNSPNITQIVCAGHMYLNHRLRMLLAGIDPAKIVCVEDESLVPSLVNTEGAEKIFVLFEIDFVTKARQWRDDIVEYQKRLKDTSK